MSRSLSPFSFSPYRQATRLEVAALGVLQHPPIDPVWQGATVEILVQAIHLKHLATRRIEQVHLVVGWIGAVQARYHPSVVFPAPVWCEDLWDEDGQGVGA